MVWPTTNEPSMNIGGWAICGQGNNKHQGWKIHVVAEPTQIAVNTIDAVCKVMSNTGWKYLKSEKAFSGQKDEQRGKWNCVYPNTPVQSMVLAAEICRRLQQAQAHEFDEDQRPPYDKYVCPFICVRYGPYGGETLINDKGKLVPDIWKINADHPPWVEDRWGQFEALRTTNSRSVVNFGEPYPDYRYK